MLMIALTVLALVLLTLISVYVYARVTKQGVCFGFGVNHPIFGKGVIVRLDPHSTFPVVRVRTKDEIKAEVGHLRGY